MVQHVYERASAARLIDAVAVATDDTRIAEAVDGFGGFAVLTRSDHATGTDRLAEVAAAIAATIIVNVQGDEPLTPGEAIDDAVRPLVERGDVEMSTLRRRLDDPADLADPSVVKIVVDREGFALYFTRSAVPFVRPGHPVPEFWRHPGLYAYRRERLLELSRLPQTPLEQAEGLEQLRALEHGLRILTVPTTAETFGIDTPEDLERIRRLFEPAAHAP